MSRTLRILFVVHNPTRRGGAYYRGLNLAAPLARQGHDVALLSIHPNARWRLVEREADGIRLIESPDLFWGMGRSGWDPWDTLRRTLWIRQQKLDVIHTVDTRPAVSLPALLARRRSGAVWVADWTDWWGRGGATEEREGWVVRRLIGPLELLFEERPRPYADATVVISQALRERVERLGVPRHRILYLPPGADPRSIRDTEPSKARERLGLDAGTRYVGYLGNIYPRDADLLFAALRRLRAPGVRLIMVGDPGCRIDPSVADRVTVTGRLPFDEMLDHLSACDVLALPLSDTVANRGRWPSKVNEYVAVGRPVVACGVGDVAGLLHDHGIGLLAPPEAEAFAAQLDVLLEDPERAAAMGTRAREIAMTSYSQDAIAERLERFYRSVLDTRALPDAELAC